MEVTNYPEDTVTIVMHPLGKLFPSNSSRMYKVLLFHSFEMHFKEIQCREKSHFNYAWNENLRLIATKKGSKFWHTPKTCPVLEQGKLWLAWTSISNFQNLHTKHMCRKRKHTRLFCPVLLGSSLKIVSETSVFLWNEAKSIGWPQVLEGSGFLIQKSGLK